MSRTDGIHETTVGPCSWQSHLATRSGFLQPPPSRLVAYSAGLGFVAVALFILLSTVAHTPLGSAWTVACLALVAVAAERASVRLTATTEISISLVPTLFAGVLFGPLSAMAVGAASNLLDLGSRTDWPLLKWMTYTSTRAFTGAAVGATAIAIEGASSGGIGGVVAGTTAAALVAEALDIGFASLTRAVRGTADVRELVRATAPLAVASVPLYAPLVAMLVIAYQEISPWTLPLFMAPTLAAQRLYVLYQNQRRLTDDVLSINERLERANMSFATALVATLDARDEYTAGHSAAVAIYARDITRRMGLPSDVQKLAHLCGLVHDIGKVGLPAGLLEKPGALTLEERRQMEKHSEIGHRILLKVDDYAEIANIVRHHHERIDGNGYPDGLTGDDIPLLSRILSVADAYNAMTSDRPYRDAMPSRVARMRLAQAVGSQFDTSVVAAFEAILATAPDTYRSGNRSDFQFDHQAVPSEHPALATPVAVIGL